MNRAQPQTQSCQGTLALRPAVVALHRLGVLTLAGWVIAAGVAGVSSAAQPNRPATKKPVGHVPSGLPSQGIRDPMNPQAYMADLAARMDSSVDTSSLRGNRGTRTGSARAGQAGRPGPRSGVPARTTAPEPQPQPQVPAAALPADRYPVPAAPQATPPAPYPQGYLVPSGAAVAPSVPARTAEPTPAPTMPPLGTWNTVPAPGRVERPAFTGQAPPSTPALAGQHAPYAPAPVPTAPMAAGRPGASARTPGGIENLMAQGPVPVERQLALARPGLTLWYEPGAQDAAVAPAVADPSEPAGPWTLGGDLEKYRAHSVKEGSRKSGESLKKALRRAGMTISDSANVFVLGYGSERAKPFRANDGKGLLQEPGKVPAAAGRTVVSLGDGLYSLADLITFNALPDPNKPSYQDNNPLVRPFVYTGRTIGGVWKTTEEVGNAVTWGLFDNFTGCVGLVIEDIVEFLKHAGQAVTNVVRAPVRLLGGKNKEGTDRALDWVLLVPLEFASNAVEMKGIANMDDYKTAFADKGVIGSILEFGGSTYIVYRAIDELLDDDNRNSNQDQSQNQNPTQQQGGGTTPPAEPPVPPKPQWPNPDAPPPVDTPPISYDVEWYFSSDGGIIE